jgi:hypothetical protein
MFGRPVLSVYARDLKVGMVTRDNGPIVRIRAVAPQWYVAPSLVHGGEPLDIGVRYRDRLGIQMLAPHDIVPLKRL